MREACSTAFPVVCAVPPPADLPLLGVLTAGIEDEAERSPFPLNLTWSGDLEDVFLRGPDVVIIGFGGSPVGGGAREASCGRATVTFTGALEGVIGDALDAIGDMTGDPTGSGLIKTTVGAFCLRTFAGFGAVGG